MKFTKYFAANLITFAALLSLAGCSGMTRQDRDTAIGAGAGAVAGSVLSDGSGIGTVGGAAVGGVIGHEVGKGKY